MEELELMNTHVITGGFLQLVLHFVINIITVGLIVAKLYYPRSRRRDYTFTFILISVSIFLMIFLLGSVKIQIGFALGLFAVFGIIRYRTEQMPVREMTYLFVIISISVVNALASDLPLLELVFADVVFFLAVWGIESTRLIKHVSIKTIRYDRIDLITPDKHDALLADLEKRTGLKIIKIEIGDLDFLKDMALIRISYETFNNEVNNSDSTTVDDND